MEHKIIMPLDIIIEVGSDNNIRQGTTIKIPLEPRYATENIYNVSSTSTIQEVFWYQDDVNWKTIMVNGGYNNNLFTPMGAIGIGVNGVPFYNFSVMKNTLTETYSSTSLSTSTNSSNNYSANTTTNTSYGSSTTTTSTASSSYSYGSSTSLNVSLSTNNSSTVENAVTSSNEVFDSQGGNVDMNYHYHYHYYPAVLEGQIYFGTVSKVDPDGSILSTSGSSYLINNQELKLYIGHTYLF